MTYHALIPVKSLKNAKSRLARYLSPKERKKLVLQMLDHVITVLLSSKDISQITIVTPDEEIHKHVKNKKIVILSEEKAGYNASLTFAAHHEDNSNKTLLTIPADLPFITKNDIQELIALSKHNSVVVAPAKDNGTNALVMHPPLILPYLFGKNSFEKYQHEAKKRKLTVGIYNSETLALDIDTVEDLQKMYSYATITDNKGNIR